MADVTDATFEHDVLDRSVAVPVVVDLWAPWCGPCRTLGPIIERVVADTDGAVELAKVNVDDNPAVSQAFQVQGIPAVYAIRDRQVVDHFVGAQPEHLVRAFVERLAPKATEADLLVDQGDEESLRRALELEPDHQLGVTRLAQILVDRGEGDEAIGLLARIPESAETRRIAALARTGAAPDSSVEDELESLLGRVRDDDAARQRFVDLLEVLGPDDPRTARYRRELTSRLF